MGHLDGSTSVPRRPPRPAPSRHSRPSFATTTALTALAHAPEHPLDVSGAFSLLVFSPAPVCQLPSPPPACRHSRATPAFNSNARWHRAVGKPLGSVQGTHSGHLGYIGWLERAQRRTGTQVRRRPHRILTPSHCAPQVRCTLQKTGHEGSTCQSDNLSADRALGLRPRTQSPATTPTAANPFRIRPPLGDGCTIMGGCALVPAPAPARQPLPLPACSPASTTARLRVRLPACWLTHPPNHPRCHSSAGPPMCMLT